MSTPTLADKVIANRVRAAEEEARKVREAEEIEKKKSLGILHTVGECMLARIEVGTETKGYRVSNIGLFDRDMVVSALAELSDELMLKVGPVVSGDAVPDMTTCTVYVRGLEPPDESNT